MVNVEGGDNVEPTVDLHLCTRQDEQVALGVDANESGLGRDRLQNFRHLGCADVLERDDDIGEAGAGTLGILEAGGHPASFLRTANEQAIVGSMHHHRTVVMKQGLQNRQQLVTRDGGTRPQCHRTLHRVFDNVVELEDVA